MSWFASVLFVSHIALCNPLGVGIEAPRLRHSLGILNHMRKFSFKIDKSDALTSSYARDVHELCAFRIQETYSEALRGSSARPDSRKVNRENTY